MTGRTRREVERLQSELEQSRPYLELAREIQLEVDRAVADPDIDVGALSEMFDRWPRDARAEAVTATFRNLPRLEQWAVLAQVFDDDELRKALEHDHRQAAARARRTAAGSALRTSVGERQALDMHAVPPGEELVLGMYREGDVRAALVRGSSSTGAARRVVLCTTDVPGHFHVIADVFNPDRGLFVTADYDEERWQAERLDAHAVVAVGSVDDDNDTLLSPVVYPGGRLDVEVAGVVRPGVLHAGYATVGGVDLFVPSPTEGVPSS